MNRKMFYVKINLDYKKFFGNFMKTNILLFFLIMFFISDYSFAHPGHDHQDFISNILHPLRGLDHILILVLSGFFIAIYKKSNIHIFIILLSMSIGIFSGTFLKITVNIPSLILSFIIMNLSIFLYKKSLFFSFMLNMLFFIHGYVHGFFLEKEFFSFTSGIIIGSCVLFHIGFFMGIIISYLQYFYKNLLRKENKKVIFFR